MKFITSERKTVESDTQESSPEAVPVCVGRNSRIIPLGGKRQVQPLISDVAKKMSSNIAKRKREEEEQVHWEDDWEEELYSNSSNYVIWNKYVNGEVASFGLLPYSNVLHGQTTVSNMGGIPRVELSC